ncbi:MAG: hypothetical protein JWM93_208 [Frankiales bacterium]|nr:hypothetical protein [Frankiales bacterium]
MTKESMMKMFIAAMASAAAVILPAQAAQADFGLSVFDTSVSVNGQFSRQAGAHPDFTTKLMFSGNESIRDVTVDLPPGMVGNPNATDQCTLTKLIGVGTSGATECPATSQVGVARIYNSPGDTTPAVVNVYNIVAPSNLPALFAFNYQGVIARIEPRLRPSDGYAISTDSKDISVAQIIAGVEVTLWGVPADSSHERMGQMFDLNTGTFVPIPDPAPRRPFLTAPTSCPSTATSFSGAVDSWQSTGTIYSARPEADRDGVPYLWDGCERLSFDPSIKVEPGSHTADAPSGLTVDVNVPQNDDPDGLATPHVRKTIVQFPKGMSVSPSSAAGLGACAPSEIKLGTNDEPTCPESSKIGTVSITTPLLAAPLEGDVILAKQDDNPFRSLLALYMVVRGPGILVKLPGRVDLDQNTGQITATFDNTPQLPFSRLHVVLRGGSTAPMATPTACGTYNTHASVTSWASSAPVELDTPMVIDQGCERRDFNPAVSAGATNTVAGADTSFRFAVSRPDRSAYLSSIGAVLPPGLLARIADVPQCGETDASAGTCSSTSDVGSTSVLSGPGDAPLGLTGRVYLTGPYKGAPFGLSIVVQTRGQAGPFDLGAVVVRAGIYVDRTDAHATVKSDPLPTIIQGIPLRLRQAVVTIDRPGFMFNPTNCAAKSIFAGLGSTDGNNLTREVSFQVTGCSVLPVNQKLTLSLTGKSSTTDGTHPGIRAHLTSAKGSSNLKKVSVALPLSLALDPDNAQGLCTPQQRVALACPAKSIVGTATAKSILPHPLTGPVYFVEGLRKSASGRTIRTLPKLWIPLSGDGVTIDVNADSEVRQDRLVTTFDNIPDAPIQTFDLAINGGKHGIIVVSGKPGTCDRSRILDGELTGQTGSVTRIAPAMSVQGCKPTVKRKKSSSKSLTVQVTNLGAGKVTVAGSRVVKASRTLKGSTQASVTLKWTAAARQALRRHKSVTVKLTTTFLPKKGSAVRSTKTLTVGLD